MMRTGKVVIWTLVRLGIVLGVSVAVVFTCSVVSPVRSLPVPPDSSPASALHRADTEMSARISADAWPASWSKPTQTASEVGIDRYRESPMLAERTEAGELPPVTKRLPADPIVVEPYHRIGRYGGTLRVFDSDQASVNPIETLVRIGPQVSEIFNNLAKQVQYSEDGRTVTVQLRRGIRWSDGHPLTADDYVFWFDHVLMNEQLNPVVGRPFADARIEKLDDYTFAYHMPQPTPLLTLDLAGSEFTLPKHFMRQFHPAFTDEHKLTDLQRRLGFANWVQLFEAAQSQARHERLRRPVLRAYQQIADSPTVTVWERNPYYYKVDPQGNQLPYIDRVHFHRVDSRELAAAQASTGQMHFVGFQLRTDDIPLLKRWEDRNHYHTRIWRTILATDVLIQMNLTHDDRRLRELFRDRRFRLALSFAINRQEISDILYFGAAVDRQNTVLPTSRYHDPALEKKNIAYDPDKARALLDEIGMVDRTGDGRREHPDGKRVDITIEFFDFETPKRQVLELVTSYWRDVGVHINVRPLAQSLQAMRATGNMMDMTVWHADRATDVLFPIMPSWYVPMHMGWDTTMWNRWVQWQRSDGEHGEMPPEEIRQAIDWWHELRITMDESRRIELGRRILASQAENMWAIPTVGLGPRPIVVSRDLHNVSPQGYWGWDNRWMSSYHPQTWYLAPRPTALRPDR